MTQLKKFLPFLIIVIILIIVMTYKKLALPKESQLLEPLDPDDCVPTTQDDDILSIGSKGIEVKRLQIRMSYCIDLLKSIKANPNLLLIPGTDDALQAYEEFLLHKGVDGIYGTYTQNLKSSLVNLVTPIDTFSLNGFRKLYTYLKNYDVKASKSIMNNISDNSNFN